MCCTLSEGGLGTCDKARQDLKKRGLQVDLVIPDFHAPVRQPHPILACDNQPVLLGLKVDMATSDEHKRLTLMGASWLKKMGFGAVGTEMFCHESRERPDVVGFRTSCSAVIEVKVSRSDFFCRSLQAREAYRRHWQLSVVSLP